MQYVKWQCISVFKLTFSHTYVQYLVQNSNEIIWFTLAISYTSFNMQNKNILTLYKLQNENVLHNLIRYV